METIARLKEGPNKPYQTPLHCIIASRSDVITYLKDGIQKDMMCVALCDQTDFVKAISYDPDKLSAFADGSTVYVKTYICRSDKTLVLTSQTKIYKAKPMEVPGTIKAQAVNLVRPPTPPPLPIKDIKLSPIKTMTSVSGEVTQDEVAKEVIIKGQPTFVRNIQVAQHKEAIKVSLWRKDAEADIRTGDFITAKNVVVRNYQGEVHLSTTSRTCIEKSTPPDENLNITLLSVCQGDDEVEFNLLCQIDGDTVTELSCSQSILENMLPEDYDTEEHLDEPLHDSIMQLLPAICSVLVSSKKIIAVSTKLESLNA